MRVMHVINGFELGGAERILASLVDEMNPEEFEMSVCCLGQADVLRPLIKREHVPVFDLEMATRLDPRGLWRMAALLKRERPDLVHTHLPRAGVIGRLAARLVGVGPVVHTAQNPWSQFSIVTGVLNAGTYGLNHAVVCVSEGVRASLSRKWRQSERVVVIRNCVRCDAISSAVGVDPASRDELGIPPGVPIVGTMGRLHAQKGQTYLLDAIKLLRSAGRGVFLVVVGAGKAEEALRRKADRLGIADSVLFAGFREDRLRIARLFDVFAFPSLSEGLGVALLEAMALGLPVVASDIPGAREAAPEPDVVVFVPPKDAGALAEAIGSVLDDPRAARKMGLRAQALVSRAFNIEGMVQAYEQLYRQVARNGTPEGFRAREDAQA